MIVIERNSSFWLSTTAREAHEVQAVQIRLQAEDKNFEAFEQRLENWERVDAGVIQVYKCSNASRCVDCDKCIKCEIRLRVQETAQAHAEWVKWF